jgi:DUF4097 and DUF4098 domain-containing protein YvlB
MKNEPMRAGRIRWMALAGVVALVALAMPGPVQAQWGNWGNIVAEGRFEKALTVSGAVELTVKSNWGNITVRPGNGSTVRVVGIIKVRKLSRSEAQARVKEVEQNPPIRQSGNVINIGYERGAWSNEDSNRVGISYELVVPATAAVTAATGSGNVTVDGTSGATDAQSGSGNVALTNVGGDGRAHTGSGNVHIQNVKGQLRASTGSGDIRGMGIGGAIHASTGSGNIDLAQSGAGNVEASTGSGDIELSGVKGGLRVRTGSGGIRIEGQPTANWNVHSGSGSIRVRLPADASFELAASTGSGGVETAHPITLQGRTNRRELRGKVRNGGPLVDLNTGSGAIHID